MSSDANELTHRFAQLHLSPRGSASGPPPHACGVPCDVCAAFAQHQHQQRQQLQHQQQQQLQPQHAQMPQQQQQFQQQQHAHAPQDGGRNGAEMGGVRDRALDDLALEFEQSLSLQGRPRWLPYCN